ncbi:MAG: DUF3995 domain-containing protein [Cyclobacteriaceae bacterium]
MNSVQVAFTLLLSFTFLVLGLVHFNWVVGGKWGWDAALPTKENGKRVLNPRKIDSFIVGVGLVVFGLFYLVRGGLVGVSSIPAWIFEYGSWIIPIIFLLRAVGDFTYVGFFKKIKKTKFGEWDTRLFAPLCLAIAVAGLVLVVFY